MGWISFAGAWKLIFGGRRRAVRVRRACLRLESLEARIVPAATVWTGAANDFNWFTAGNWSTGAVPTFYDDVEIPTGIVIIPTSQFAQANSITVDGGLLDVAGDLNTGAFTQSLGSTDLDAGGHISAFGGFSQTGGDVVLLGGNFRASTFDLTGGAMIGFGTVIAGMETRGNFTNNGGVLAVDNGTLNMDANYFQSATGTLIIVPVSSDVPGAAPFQIFGRASFNGALFFDITTSGVDTFPLIDYASFKGSFSSVFSVEPAGYDLAGLNYTSGELDAMTGLAPPPTVILPPSIVIDPVALNFLTRTPVLLVPPSIPGGFSSSSNQAGNMAMPLVISLGGADGHHYVGMGGDSEMKLVWEDPTGPLDTKRIPPPIATHGFEELGVDKVLADDLDHILRVQMGPFAVAFEHEALSGASIVRALLTGTTPRTDLVAQGSQVASVATILMNTDVRPTQAVDPSEHGVLPNFLIDPMQSYVPEGTPLRVVPVGPISQLPPEGGPEGFRWWNAVVLLRAAAGAIQVGAGRDERDEAGGFRGTPGR